MKICSKCKEEKPVEDFWRRGKKDNRPRFACKACDYKLARRPKMIQYQREYKRRPSSKSKQRERDTGFSQVLWDAALDIQHGRCPICKRNLASLKGYRSGWSPMHADHDHKTKRPRGVLCQDCNTGLGWFRDEPELLRAAAEYLEHPTLELL